ncbi:tail fiber assembly protein [Salmonella enterica]|uniref:Tail fiber assembly protein n=1 Tax=Salmonella enterica TaxID=28901 RepID=A0A3J5ULB4_SALER|nr:hypothetical protein [Salmonella enterica]ECF3315626.1 hypothetical protein [Salmonella enterica subsp. enterica serovar Arechavaleta]EDX5007333.1 tail fiber assembly protein [Salmonella enterica subsp. houtenae]EIN8554895.1 tail fiber assembly protein [Salmonella enterica subsp. houtenae serovar 48:g,z51:-]EAM6903399.1 hypothetical protein [Salmonella enterica]
MAMEDEKAHLDEWKKYRVLVNRVDTLKPVWPKKQSKRVGYTPPFLYCYCCARQ